MQALSVDSEFVFLALSLSSFFVLVVDQFHINTRHSVSRHAHALYLLISQSKQSG